MSDYFNVTGTIGFTCDVCGRETQGCTWVNGMKFCAKCYQETFGNTNPFEKELRDKIADLEHQLANCIKHKFDFGKDVWVIFNDQVKKTQINSFRVYPDYDIEYYIKFIDGIGVYLDLWEDEIFATKEEAEKKLEELKK